MYLTSSSHADDPLPDDRAQVTVEPAGVRIIPIDPLRHTLDVYLGGAVSDYVSRGERTFTTPCPPGSFRFLRRGSVEEIRTTRSGITLRLHFAAELLATAVAAEQLAKIDCEHRYDDALIGIATALVEALDRPVFSRIVRLRATTAEAGLLGDACRVLYGRLAHCLAREPDLSGVGRPAAVQQAIEFVEANLHRALTLERVAETVNLSQYYFARLFRREMNTSLQRYVISRRVERARELLVRGDDALSDIAYRVGFGSQSHMTTLFKKYSGRTPGQIRRTAALRLEPRDADTPRSA